MAVSKTGISINLLPSEYLSEEIKSAKFYKIQTIGVSIILITIFLASLTVALRILQSSNISAVQSRLNESEGKILALKDRQSSLVLLKNRISAISQNLGVVSKQNSMYILLEELIPKGVSITSQAIDKEGNAQVAGLVSDSDTLDSLIFALTSTERNQGKISKVSIESLSRGRDGFFRISLKINSI